MKKLLIFILQSVLILNCIPITSNAAAEAVAITASAPQDIYGNNFYKDNPPRFTVSIKNEALDSTFSGSVSYEVQKTDGTVVIAETKVKDIEISAGGTDKFELAIKKEYYGRLNLNIKVSSGDSRIIPYTMSNNETSNPSNKRFGVAGHLGKNRGDIDKVLPLLKNAGIGAIRDEFIMWSNVETVKGKYNFTYEMDRRLDLIDKYDLFYIHLWGHGNYDVYPDADLADTPEYQYLFPTTQEGLTGLSSYMEKLAEFAAGRIDVIEVWNEYNNMSGPYNRQYEYMKNYHKAVYDGINNKIPVSGIDTDSWGVYKTGEMRGFLELLNGEKVFDAVSLHPYNNLEGFNADPPETGITKSIVEDTKTILTQNGQSSDVDFYFTESGWSDNLFDGSNAREMQAAYNLRHQTKIFSENLAKISCLYSAFDYGEKTGNEAHFGMLESYNPAYAEIPYLGKESYPAIAYYNNLMAEADSVEAMDTDYGENVAAYHFKDRFNRDVYMLNTKDNTTQTITLNQLGADNVTVADMYGNETQAQAADGSITTQITGVPKYIIADNRNGIYGVVSGKTTPNEKLVLNVYNDGFTPENTTSENVAEAFYYTEQKSANYKGEFRFSFPLDENFKSKNAYIYTGSEVNPRTYKTEAWGDFALSYEVYPEIDENNHEFFAYLSGEKTIGNIELISAGYLTKIRT